MDTLSRLWLWIIKREQNTLKQAVEGDDNIPTTAVKVKVEGDDDTLQRKAQKSRKRKTMSSSPPPVPQAKKVKLPWTKAEEEFLREIVPKYKAKGTNIPWKKILEKQYDDSGVFLSRTPEELKDKWRRMCRKDKEGDVAATTP